MHTAAHELYARLSNVIMLPTLLLSAAASVLSIMLKGWQYGPYIVASMSATSTFLIGVQQHLKVEAKAESYKISAHRFDQLVTEAVSRSIITGINVRDVSEWEKELHRIAEANQFVMPSSIRRRCAGPYSPLVLVAALPALSAEEATLPTTTGMPPLIMMRPGNARQIGPLGRARSRPCLHGSRRHHAHQLHRNPQARALCRVTSQRRRTLPHQRVRRNYNRGSINTSNDRTPTRPLTRASPSCCACRQWCHPH